MAAAEQALPQALKYASRRGPVPRCGRQANDIFFRGGILLPDEESQAAVALCA